ncbi:5-formyltetrahydrofolate cyclo-ligase, partial [uncultured Oscillibacter sp.]|uniref:5-formyltetrahydrofolate cyclo-ligase n=2 Tax=uncultured Oscillibacter sp. TaxID=876091 RepID=UPI00272C3739
MVRNLIGARRSHGEHRIPGVDRNVRGEKLGVRQGETVCKAMMWMPGAVFDRERHRIGYGKGFYDRYLARLRSTAVCQADGRTGLHLTTAALAYACQIVTRIPSEA